MQGRTVLVVLFVLLAGCGGGGPKSDADQVSQVLKDAAKAVAGGDGEKACSYLTPEAQRQAELQVGNGVLGQADCPTLVNRATAFLNPLDKKQIEDLQPQNVVVNGTSASATLAANPDPSQSAGVSVQMNLQKVGTDWKISGFVNEQGLPGG